jgi:hypothetical protein
MLNRIALLTNDRIKVLLDGVFPALVIFFNFGLGLFFGGFRDKNSPVLEISR